MYEYFINTNGLITTVNQLFPAVSNFLCNFIRINSSKIALIIASLIIKVSLNNMLIEELKKHIETISKEYDLKKVILFGSQADGTYNDDSDIDLLVEYNTDSKSLFTTIGLRQNIEKKFNKKVDIVRYPIPEYGIKFIINKEVPIYG